MHCTSVQARRQGDVGLAVPRKKIVKYSESMFCRLEYVFVITTRTLYYIMLIRISRFRISD